jgi:hypothetical protein
MSSQNKRKNPTTPPLWGWVTFEPVAVAKAATYLIGIYYEFA